MNALLVFNAGAGSVNGDKARIAATDVVDAFAEAGVQIELRETQPNQLCPTLATAVAERPEALFVAGGDGTISAAAGCLADSGVPLGVLPFGTLNHFARDLGLPTDWREAVAALSSGHPQTVDVGEVNGRIFINNCSLGSYPEAVRARDAIRRSHGAGKWIAMALATVMVFRRLRRLRLRIETPGETLALRTPFVFIGNNAYSGHVLGHYLRPQLDEGRLWIYTTRARRRLTLLRLVWQSLVRNIDEADALEAHALAEATIRSERGHPLPIAADGELLAPQAEVRLRIRPRALTVISPRRASENRPVRGQNAAAPTAAWS